MLGQGGKIHNMGFLSCIIAISDLFFVSGAAHRGLRKVSTIKMVGWRLYTHI